ncbi:glycosyltransferase family 2 protein [Aquirhabdus sp.]|uniref:glycosyltransferase family 2 protein n=1 Tax=Aquirhabdus sp. TaxID=2824160 RepID=UPI00396C3819
MTIACSVYIVSLNSAPWLKALLESVHDFAEVIILDSGSTDATYEIAQQFNNVTIQHQDWLGYAAQKAKALSLCRQPWALNLDGDEKLSAALRDEIQGVIARNEIDGLITPILDSFMGKVANTYTKQHAKVRFFRREKGSYDTAIEAHEKVQVDGIVQPAQGVIYHYGLTDISVKVDKNNRYSDLKAKEKNAKGKRPSLLKLVLVMPLVFFKSYVLRRDFLNGQRGFISSMINAFYAFLKEAKLYEYHLKNISADSKVLDHKPDTQD